MTVAAGAHLAAAIDATIADALKRQPSAENASGGGGLRLARAAEYLDVSADTIAKLIRRGELATFHAGRATRVTRASLDAFIDRGGLADLTDEVAS